MDSAGAARWYRRKHHRARTHPDRLRHEPHHRFADVHQLRSHRTGRRPHHDRGRRADGPNIQLLAPTHPLDSERRIAGWESGEPITIEDGCWLGGGVIVCPGVTIGRRSVIGAGAVVTRDIPPFSLAVGNPARVIRALR
ncbi:hypothetical protein JRG19_03045 [Pseudoclavibacter alba]|nr:hypothetical protein [Pseudoclavibacter alba]